MTTFGYIRVSSVSQNIDRQLDDMLKFKIKKSNIFIDYQSGKDFCRENYQRLKKRLKPGDELVIKSIDRLGRNYRMITEEWAEIVGKGVNIVVLDMPILNTKKENLNLVGKFISDIVLQILSFVAENERDNIKLRQAEGIRIAKEKGKTFGRPKVVLPKDFNDLVLEYRSKKISLDETLTRLNLKKSTFYNLLKKDAA